MKAQLTSASARARALKQTVALNEALVLGSVRQHELTERAENLNDQLRREMAERRKAEEALRESEERYRTLFELGPIAVYSCDAAGVIQQFNRHAEKLWGRTPAIGETDERFCGSYKLFRTDGSIMPHAQCPMAQVVSGQIRGVRDAEVMIGRPDGSLLTVLVNIRPLKNKRGELKGAINCFYDISERKRAEDALRLAHEQLARHAGQLEVAVADRTAKLTATNRRLETSVESNRQGKEKYQALFLEAQDMHVRLRYLARQILTAQEEERKEISRELHDEVVQTLVGINVALAALGRGAALGLGPLRAKIARTRRLVENSVNEVHRFARELRPAVLDDLGLIPALHAYSRNLAARKKIKIHLTAFAGVEALGGTERTVMFRVAQEALTNVVRHAHATKVSMNITEIPGAIRMEIQDNGRSFHVAKILFSKNPKRLGLVGMRERIEMIGGFLTIDSAPGRGTTVRTEIPFTSKKTKT